jgi:hypothetical protein
MEKVGLIFVETVQLLRFLMENFIILLREAFRNNQGSVFFRHDKGKPGTTNKTTIRGRKKE